MRRDLINTRQDYFERLNAFARGGLSISDPTSKPLEEFWKSYRKLAEFDKPENQYVIKVLKPREENKHFEKAIERTNSEIASMKKVKHPHLIELVDCDTINEWFISPYYQNGSLDKNISHFTSDFSKSIRFFRKIVDAVAALHKQGIVHRDIKPQNIFLKSIDHPIVGDFGLTYYMGADDQRLTFTKETVGTKYWRPEWAALGIRFEDVKPNFDVYSLGKIFWVLLSGQHTLPLWYWDDPDHPEYNLEKLFPDAKGIHYARQIFEKTIVQKQRDCLNDASELLSLVDSIIKNIDLPIEPIFKNPKRHCIACGDGQYQPIVTGERDDARRFGFDPQGLTAFMVHKCNNCGHVQVFSAKDGQSFPEFWKQWLPEKKNKGPF